MPVRRINKDNEVIFRLIGELDHHNITEIRDEIDSFTYSHHPRQLVLDFGGVEFMDSSGIGLVLGRYRLMKELEGKLTLSNMPAHIKKVMRLAGIENLAIDVREGE